MELKFTATVTITEAEIRRLIEAEILRKHKDVKVTNVAYNVPAQQQYGGGMVVGGVAANGIVSFQSSGYLAGAFVTVERT